jgi:hypothetical protein
LEGLPLLQDPKFLESLYQHLYLQSTDFEIVEDLLKLSWHLISLIFRENEKIERKPEWYQTCKKCK